PGNKIAITAASTGFARVIGTACQVLDVGAPDYFELAGHAGGARVGALSDAQGVYPTLIAGDEALVKQDERASAFRAARAVARLAPTNLLAAALPSPANLRDVVLGSWLAVDPNAPLSADQADGARGLAEAIQQRLPGAHQDMLRRVAPRVGERVARGAVDLRNWLRGVEFTCTRAGFVM